MKIYKICTKKEREGKKNNWPEIGVLFENDRGQISGYLNNNPNVQIYLFEQKSNSPSGNQSVNNAKEVFGGNIDTNFSAPDDLGF